MSARTFLQFLRAPTLQAGDHRRVNLIVRESLQPVTIGLAVLYAFFAASHATMLPPASSAILTAVAAALAAIYFLSSVALRVSRVPLSWAHPLAAAIIGLALGHSLLELYLVADPQQTTNIALVILGAGLLLLSVRWLALVIVVSLVGWTAVAFNSGPAPGWFYFAVLLSASSALALTINAVRNTTQQRIAELRRQDALQTEQLAATMQVALESEARFRTVVQTAGSAILVLDAHYLALEFNAAAEALYGVRRDQLIGQDVRKIFGVDLDDPLFAQLDHVLAGSPARGIESRVRPRGGRERTVLWNITGFYERSGRPSGVIAIGQDITSRKRAEEAQRFLSDVSRVLVSSLDDTALVHTVARLAVPQFADWCSITVFGADETSPPVTAVAHLDPVKEVQLRELHQRQPGRELTLVGAIRHSPRSQLFAACEDGLAEHLPHTPEERTALEAIGCSSAMGTPLMARGEIRGVLVFALAGAGQSYSADDLELLDDLAGRVALAIDNARLYHNAQRALQARDDFLSVAAHELKTPVIALVGATQLFGGADDHPSPELVQRQIFIVRKATGRLHKLIDSLIELTQIQAGTIGMQRKAVDLCQLAERVVEAVQPAPRHHFQVTCAAPAITLLGDEARLELALYNLVQNAVKYSPRGGTIWVDVGQSADHATVSVRDEGIGVPLAAQTQLFERFFRAGNVNPAQIGGMGIGLHLVHDIVTRHGGTVELSSVEGHGSTFTICLPRSTAAQAELTIGGAEPRQLAGPS